MVIGIALSVAIYNLIDPSARPTPIRLANLFGFGVILVTIIPFYHGAVRHLYATYIESGSSSRIRNGALLLDFVILFLEGCFFVAIAIVLSEPWTLVFTYMLLLFLDSFWGFLAKLAFTGAAAQTAEWKWSLINIVTIILLLSLIAITHEPNDFTFTFWEKLAIFSIALGRTIFDYTICWNFYYPPETK